YPEQRGAAVLWTAALAVRGTVVTRT
ncbi:MAG: hypothetical protein QOD61_2508, partial [Solirubrobacteraceae bacterium]|nr:hypothetical protein [Solirubrobacteraceae bacterium]